MQAHQLGVSAGRYLFSPALLKTSVLINRSIRNKGASTPSQLQAAHSRSGLHSLIKVSAKLQENVAESSAAGVQGTALVKVKFVLERRCEFGQHFNVVGDDDSFGAWIPEASLPMQWSEGHVWTTEMEVLAGKRVEFKVILMGAEGVVDWQPGPNRVLEPLEALSSPVILTIKWSDDDSCLECGIQSNETEDMESLSDLAVAVDKSCESVMNLETLSDLAVSGDKSSDSDVNLDGMVLPVEDTESLGEETVVDVNLDGMVLPVEDTESLCEETVVDVNLDGMVLPVEDTESLCEETVVDEVPVEIITEVAEQAEQLTEDSISEDAKKEKEKRPTVLGRDLQWGREVLSMLWSTFVQKEG